MKTFLSKSIKAVFLGLLFGAISVYAAGITSPSGTPSTMNAALPINVSANNQLKQGGIGMSSLLVGPGAVLPSPTNASILGSLRIGTGTVPTGTGNLQINDRASIGSGITWSGIPANSLSVAGFTSSGTGMWTPANITAGLNGLVNPPTAAGTSGAIIANKFCFAGTNGACTTTWGSGTGSATFPAGLLGQTLYYATAGTTVTPTSTFSISGTSATINGIGAATDSVDAWARFTVNNGGLLVNKNGTDALLLNNTASGATYLSIVSNVPGLNFWSSDAGGHNSDIAVRDVTARDITARDVLASRNVKAVDLYASSLANGTSSNVCADSVGKLILCSTTGGGGTTTSTSLQAYWSGSTGPVTAGTLGNSVSASTFTVPAGVTQIAVDVIGSGGGATSPSYAGGGGGRSLAFINVTPGSTFSISTSLGGTSGSCSVNTDGANSVFSGAGYMMIAQGGHKAGCSSQGLGGDGLSGAGSTNLTGRTGNYNGGGYGGDPAPCTPGANSPCSSFNISGYGRGGDATAYGATGGVIIITWASPNTTGTPVLAAGGISQTVTFNTAGSHTWTVPAGVTQMDIQVIGAGGGASGAYGSRGGSGGGGGGYINAQNISVTPGQSFSMIIGAGGSAGAVNSNGGNGGTTTFNSAYVANGGTGGQISSGSGVAGVGGTAAGPLGSANSGANGTLGLASSPFTGGTGGYSGGGPSFVSGKGGNGAVGNSVMPGGAGTSGAVVIIYQ